MMYRGLGAVSAFCIGIAAADYLGVSLTEWAAACLAAVLLAAAARKTRWAWPLILLFCLLAGGARLQLAAEQYDGLPHYVGGADIYMEGTIRETGHTYKADGKTMARYVVDMERFAYVGSIYFLCGIMDVMSGALRGLGRSVMPAVITLVGVCVLRIVWVYTVFPVHPTMGNLMLSYPITWAIVNDSTTFALSPRMSSFRKRRIPYKIK